jgi:uncharacterized protein (TIGR03067 family)
VVAVLAVLAVTGLTRADDKNTEAGTYTFVSVIHDGKEVPADELKTYVLTLTESKYTVKKGDQVLEEGTYKVDRNKTPFQLERTASTGDNKGKTFLGICEQTGDTMKVCWGAPNGDRPTEFSSKSGSGHVLEVIKRSGK